MLRLIGCCFDRINFDPMVHITLIDARRQIADFHSKVSVIREKWDRWIRLFSRMDEKTFSSSHFRSFRLHLDESMSTSPSARRSAVLQKSRPVRHLCAYTSRQAASSPSSSNVNSLLKLGEILSRWRANGNPMCNCRGARNVDKHDSVKDGEIGCDILHKIRGFSVDPRTN